ncbi:MAG: hypothetical protein V1493_02950 [Candidatus Diapherotrites archaeon]
MGKRRTAIPNAMWRAANPLLKGIEVARGERLSKRRKARLDRAKKADLFGYTPTDGEAVHFGLGGRTIGRRRPELPNLPTYTTDKTTILGTKISREFNSDGALTKRTREPKERRSDRPDESTLTTRVSTTKIMRSKKYH